MEWGGGVGSWMPFNPEDHVDFMGHHYWAAAFARVCYGFVVLWSIIEAFHHSWPINRGHNLVAQTGLVKRDRQKMDQILVGKKLGLERDAQSS